MPENGSSVQGQTELQGMRVYSIGLVWNIFISLISLTNHIHVSACTIGSDYCDQANNLILLFILISLICNTYGVIWLISRCASKFVELNIIDINSELSAHISVMIGIASMTCI